MDNISKGFVIIIQVVQDFVNKILMIKRFPKSNKLIGSTLDKLHVFSDCLGTLDRGLELVLDLLNMPMRSTNICVGQGEPGVTRGGGLLNWRDQGSRDKSNNSTKKAVCLDKSKRENPDLEFPCRGSESWPMDKGESHQYICGGRIQ